MKKRGSMKGMAFLLVMVMITMTFIGCQGKDKETSGENGGSELSGSLTFAIWDNNMNDYIEEGEMIERFQEVYPNIDIEVENIKDDGEYFNSMKMRASANQLPDVMFNKPFTLSRFREYLIDLSDTQAANNNELADGYAVDGKVLGVPLTVGYEYIYYWKDMFKEAGVEVPTTWSEFEECLLTLQAFYEKDNADFMALACGVKDEWPTYPYMEFMPALESGEGQNWNVMATQDAPFAEGTDINKAYSKVYDLFSSGVLGKDPLGLGNDQVTALFASKGAAAIALGDWGLQNIQNVTDDIEELGTFYLPTRESKEEPYNIIAQGDLFMGVTTHSKNQEAALAFLEWFYSDAWYPEYLDYVTQASSMRNFPKEKHVILKEADELTPDSVTVMYDGGGDDFTAIQNEVTFDYKKLGAQLVTDGFNLQEELNALDTKWAEARNKLDIE